MKKQRSIAISVAIVLVFILGLFAFARWYLIPYSDSVHVTVSEIAGNQETVVFDKTDTAHAPAILANLTSRTNLTGKTYSCPATSPTITFYYHYRLTFTHWGSTTATADGEAVNCDSIDITYLGVYHEAYFASFPDTQPSCWDELHMLIGAPSPTYQS